MSFDQQEYFNSLIISECPKLNDLFVSFGSLRLINLFEIRDC
jgi:hypothetical protein